MGIIREIEDSLAQGEIVAVSIGRAHDGDIQVSIRRRGGLGWNVYFGNELSEVLARAVEGGRQLPTVEQASLWT